MTEKKKKDSLLSLVVFIIFGVINEKLLNSSSILDEKSFADIV